ncbi:hypothetical protein J2S74_001401 [Evansella vedderi]|uniref:Uncharacterized protein n=1 Tax=Evansella vedderi TaxID=38282 RepID=A0ABT9ZS12_9BACI|nr:hypothetical protein [Evansella vedderi]
MFSDLNVTEEINKGIASLVARPTTRKPLVVGLF